VGFFRFSKAITLYANHDLAISTPDALASAPVNGSDDGSGSVSRIVAFDTRIEPPWMLNPENMITIDPITNEQNFTVTMLQLTLQDGVYEN
jgi:hypothetical protein